MKTFALTGRLMVGKTWLGTHCGFQEASLAEPLYGLARMFLGTDDKKVPGVREFLQRVGQWGRGTLSEKYPLTMERREFEKVIHRLNIGSNHYAVRYSPEWDYLFRKPDGTPQHFSVPAEVSGVDWRGFGTNENIWINALCYRLTQPGPLRFVSNCRFENELDAFVNAGIPVYHVTASHYTLEDRWRRAGVTEEALADVSEGMATDLDHLLVQGVHPDPARIAGIVWNDTRRCPDFALTVEQFRERVRA